MDKQVENAVQNCYICESADKSAKPVFAPLQPVPFPEKAREKLGRDIASLSHTPPDCRFAITLVDYYSTWPEVCFACQVTSDAAKTFSSAVFSIEDFPTYIVMDNGQQFKSQQFEAFLPKGLSICVRSTAISKLMNR